MFQYQVSCILILFLIFVAEIIYYRYGTLWLDTSIKFHFNTNKNNFDHSPEIPSIYLLDRFTSSRINKKSWGKAPLCLVPLKIMPLINGLYKVKGNSSISYIPCSYFNSSIESLKKKQFQCEYGVHTIPNPSSSMKTIKCLQSQTFDVFVQSNQSMPSFSINRYPLSDDFMRNILQKYYRTPTNVWGFSFHGESTGYYPWAGNKALLKLFDITEGYDRNLYHQLILSYLPRIYEQLIVHRIPYGEVLKNQMNRPSYIKSSILYINSNCNPPSGRGKYMEELMKYIQVDAWGHCHRNRRPEELPKKILEIHGKSWNTFHYRANWSNSKIAMSKSYLFTVAIENTIANDYVTEKFWQPLAAGSVPLYLGAPNIDDWALGENSFIDLRKYPSPKDLADLLKNISSNMTLYMKYHQWRKKPFIKSFQQFLNYYHRTRQYSLECLVCDLTHHRNSPERRSDIIKRISFVSKSVSQKKS